MIGTKAYPGIRRAISDLNISQCPISGIRQKTTRIWQDVRATFLCKCDGNLNAKYNGKQLCNGKYNANPNGDQLIIAQIAEGFQY